MNHEDTPLVTDDGRPRRFPCLVVYLAPFRMLSSPDLEPWELEIEGVNRRTWDHVKLHEIAGGVDVGLESPYHMLVSRDGALALPPIPTLRDDASAIQFFNRCLAALLLGGVYCEAVSNDSLSLGSIFDWKYIRVHNAGRSTANRFHTHIRQMQAAPLEAVALFKPATLSIEAFNVAIRRGFTILAIADRVSGDLLLKGVTGLARRDWVAALSNLWISVEQVVSQLWDNEVIRLLRAEGATKARREQLQDNRTWTVAVKLETLRMKGTISSATLGKLSVARKARNDLSHDGKPVTADAAQAAYSGLIDLLSVLTGNEDIPLAGLDLTDHSISDPFSSGGPIKGEPQFWMEIPKLPGEAEFERAEAKAASSKQR